MSRKSDSSVAEQAFHERCVGGSIPPPTMSGAEAQRMSGGFLSRRLRVRVLRAPDGVLDSLPHMPGSGK